MEPLEVFAITSDMQRATGSIPYTSLMWNRKYYECGDFLMEVPANVYDPSWAYICTEERPETGVIQKVEYSDTSQVADGIDTVVISGFFFECMMNRYTFLVEETEDEAYRIYKPAPAKTIMPTLWQTEDGTLIQKTSGLGIITTYHDMEGNYIDPDTIDTSKLTQIELTAGQGAEQVYYPTNNTEDFPDGVITYGQYQNFDYAYYSDVNKETVYFVDDDGKETSYDVVGWGGPTGNDAIYVDSDGNYHWMNGVTTSYDDTYVRQVDEWEYMVETEGLEVVITSGGGSYAIAYRTVKGPWQLRTDLDVNEPADNVQRIIQWAQDIWGNDVIYDEPGFAGEEKIIDPSLKLFGDMAYEELKTIGASPRFFYSFKTGACVFQVWRGLNRTQAQSGFSAPDPEPEPDEPTVDDLYETLDYVVATGWQYIDTGVFPNQDTRVVAKAKFTSVSTATTVAGGRAVFGARSSSSRKFAVYHDPSSGKLTALYGSSGAIRLNNDPLEWLTYDLNGNTFSIGGSSISAGVSSFKSEYSLYLFAINNEDAVQYPGTIAMSACQIYQDGFTLTQDLVPRRRKSDGAVGMLDLVGGVFYESAGYEPFYAPGELPVGYTQLEYIQSSGSQYIDTGFKPNQNTRVVFAFYPVSTKNTFLFGCRSSSSGSDKFCSLHASDTNAIRDDYGSENLDTGITPSGLVVIDKNKGVTTVNGKAFTHASATFQSTLSMPLFAGNTGGTVGQKTSIQLAYCKIYNNDVLARDYIPVKNINGDAGLFDLVEMKFYADAAGVGFTAGAAVVPSAAYAVAEMSEADESEPTEPTEPTKRNPWVVFSDTWGNLYGFTASKDTSNYRNKCYVLYDFREQLDEDGNQIGPRGYTVARLEDGLPDAETYLDLRGEEPESEEQTDDAFIESLRQRGLAHLQSNYAAIESLDTGTLVGDGYMRDYDLGDKVDVIVETIGVAKEARITGVCEVHEAGSSTATLEIGEQKLTNIRKAVLV